MKELDKCLILGRESIDANSLNRCMFNLFKNMGELNSAFVNATSENVSWSPFFSGGYQNALTDIDYIKKLSVKQASVSEEGVVPRLYRGSNTVGTHFDEGRVVTESVTGAYVYDSDTISTFAPTVDFMVENESPTIMKSFITDETKLVTSTKTLGGSYNPVVKKTGFILCGKIGTSFGTITFNKNRGSIQKNEIELDIKSDLIDIKGADKILFFSVGNGLASGVKTISEDGDMVTDVGDCSITYNSDTNIIISNITKGDSSDKIVIDDTTGRILDNDEEYDFNKCTILSNDTYSINFLVFFSIKDRVLEYSDDLWCFYLVDSHDTGKNIYYDATGYAENYYSYSFDNFEAVDDGKNGDNGEHIVWDTTGDTLGGCTTIASDAFNGCYNATFKSLCWFSPRLRYADRLFKNCHSATFDSLPQNIEFNNLRNGKQMFFNCISAAFDNVESISIPVAYDVQSMFEGCDSALFASLKSLSLHGICTRMFYDDGKASFALLSDIDSKAKYINSMFEGCDSASFDTLSTISMDYDGEVDSKKMFYGLEHPKFNNLVDIKTADKTTYDGTSMFEGCTNATFASLTGIGDVKCGKRMFMNLDKLDEDAESGRARFENLVSLGNRLTDGSEMFCNDRFLTLHLDVSQITFPLEIGTSMFEQVSSVTIDGDMNSLVQADYMFSNTVSAIINGNMNSISNGDNMFFNSTYASVNGTMDSLQSMYSMFLSAGDVYMKELPSTAMNMQSSFACIDNSCTIDNWKGSSEGNKRSCIQTFENSNGVTIKGNIISGWIHDTSYMFANCTNLALCNPNMSGASDTNKRYFASEMYTDANKYSLMRGFERDDGSTILSFVGSCGDINEVANFVEKDNVESSMILLETVTKGKTTFDIYSTSKAHSISVDNLYDIYYSVPTTVTENASVNVYKLTDDGEQGELYGTVNISTGSSGDIVIKMNKDGSSEVLFEQTILEDNGSAVNDNDVEDVESISTIISNYNAVDLSPVWDDATNMFHNVVQSDLLSGYNIFFSDSLKATNGMFKLDEKVENDETFRNAGYLFQNMSKSKNLTSMDEMFMNRHISNSCIFSDNNSRGHISFCIPNTIVSAESAFNNCSIDDNSVDSIYLKVPSSVVYANRMFDGYSGPNIHLNYDNTSVIYLNDNISCDKMFNGCKFHHDKDQVYGLSVPSIYLNVFGGSDFSIDNICNLDIRGYKNFAYPYSNDDFFYNDLKILGCSESGVSFKSMTGDITDWFNEKTTRIENGINAECAYLMTVVGPSNTDIKNYEILTADRSGDKWTIRLSDKSQFSEEMYEDLVIGTNKTILDSVINLSDSENRMTCMFSPNLLFDYADNELGDKLAYNTNPDNYDSFAQELENHYGVCYNTIGLSNLENVDAKEMPFAFFGLKNVTFDNLKSIGTNAMVGYGTFMGCSNATFEKLSAIEFNQPESKSVFYSRFADNEADMDSWFGNYSNMFRGDSNATFNNIRNISLNVKTATVATTNNDKLVTAFIESDGSLKYIYDGIIRRVSVIKNIVSGISTYGIIIYNNSGDQLGYYKTDVEPNDNSNFSYDLCILDGKFTIILTIADKYNNMKYFTIIGVNIKNIPNHPSRGYAKFEDEKDIKLCQFMTDAGYTDTTLHTSDGKTYIAQSGASSESETENKYYITITDSSEIGNKALIKFGSPFTDEKSIEDDRNLWYTLFEYTGNDGYKHINVTLFYSDKTPRVTSLDYGKYFISYNISIQDSNCIVEETPIVPSTVDYIHLIDLETSASTIGRNCGYFSGMFKNCSSATFKSLETIVIPTEGTCAEMFANCKSADFGNNIKTLILPTSYKKNDTSVSYSDDWKCYQRMFDGVSTECLNLENLNIENTNLADIGKRLDANNHHIIGEHLFDGMVIEGSKRTYPTNPFTYQDAIYRIKLDCDVAKNIFDRSDKTFTITYKDVFGKVLKKIVVETDPSTYNEETPCSYPTYIPSAPILDGYTFTKWSVVDNDGEELDPIYPETKMYILTCDVTATANYGGNDGFPIVATNKDGETITPIVTSPDDVALVTSFRTGFQNATQFIVTIPNDGDTYYMSGVQWIEGTELSDKYVSWGDGTSSEISTTGTISHIYSKAGEYKVSLSEKATTFYAKSGKTTEDTFVTEIVRFGSNINNLDYAFYNCTELCNKQLPNWPKGLISADYMFYGCTKLALNSIPDMTRCTNLRSIVCIFYGCYNLSASALPKLPDSVENASYAFSGCSGITALIDKWPSSVTNVNGMYKNCTGLTGAWSEDPNELMPLSIIDHTDTVTGASDAVRSLFSMDWGGSDS